MNVSFVCGVVVGQAIVMPTAALAQRPALPEELALMNSVVLQEQDELQTTAGVQYFKFPDHKETTLDAQLEYGLTDRWQLEAEIPYTFLKPNGGSSVNGVGDVEVSTEYGLLDFREQSFSLDAGFGLGLPTGDRGRELGEGRLIAEPFLVVGQWFGPISAQLNLAWRRAVTSGGTEPKNEYEYNLALIYPIQRWYLVLEGDGETTSRATKYYVTPEVIWRPGRHLFLLLAVPLGVTSTAADYGVVASVTLEIENLFHRGRDND